LKTEIDAAKESLAETERHGLDAGHLRIALKLAEDVAEVYANADGQTKRGYNQAFFKRLFVMPDGTTNRAARSSASPEPS
jgi:hypothetical protein